MLAWLVRLVQLQTLGGPSFYVDNRDPLSAFSSSKITSITIIYFSRSVSKSTTNLLATKINFADRADGVH